MDGVAACRFTFPGLPAEWSFEATCPRLQWRDRAGLAPDFPVMPLVGTLRPDRYITIHSPAAASVAARRPVTVTSSIAR